MFGLMFARDKKQYLTLLLSHAVFLYFVHDFLLGRFAGAGVLGKSLTLPDWLEGPWLNFQSSGQYPLLPGMQ